MKITCPPWIDEVAKEHWRWVYPQIKDGLTPKMRDNLAVYCQTMSDYRTAVKDKDTRQKKICQDFLIKWSKEFGLTIHADKTPKTQEDKSLDTLFG